MIFYVKHPLGTFQASFYLFPWQHLTVQASPHSWNTPFLYVFHDIRFQVFVLLSDNPFLIVFCQLCLFYLTIKGEVLPGFSSHTLSRQSVLLMASNLFMRQLLPVWQLQSRSFWAPESMSFFIWYFNFRYSKGISQSKCKKLNSFFSASVPFLYHPTHIFSITFSNNVLLPFFPYQ